MARFNINFKFPEKAEMIALVIMLFSIFALFQSSFLYLAGGANWQPHLYGDVRLSGALMFWLFFLLFHFSTMFVMARSVIIKSKKSTWNGYDFFVGFSMLIGLYFIIISTIYGVFRGIPNIEFLFNVPYITLMYAGFVIQAIGMIWYAITD
jgi:hypothetical protein